MKNLVMIPQEREIYQMRRSITRYIDSKKKELYESESTQLNILNQKENFKKILPDLQAIEDEDRKSVV